MSNNRQRGFATLTVALILMFIMLAIALIVAKVLLNDRKIAFNNLQYAQVLAVAEQGLADGLGRLRSSLSYRVTNLSSPGVGGSASVTISNDSPITVGGATITPVNIRSVAALSDGQANATVEQKIVTLNLLAGTPNAPLILAGGNGINGNFSVVANPNGGGLGVALSVWSDQTVDMSHGSSQTLQPDGSVISSPSLGKQSDVQDSDPNFPTDMVDYLFNVRDNTDGWAALEKSATLKVSSCDGLNASTTGLIIVDGNCAPGANIGSTTTPVILIVRNGSLTINGNTNIYGLVFAYSSTPSTAATDVSLKGGATIYGALASNYQLGKTANGSFTANYDQTILSTILSGGAANQFTNTATIPGSWRDW